MRLRERESTEANVQRSQYERTIRFYLLIDHQIVSPFAARCCSPPPLPFVPNKKGALTCRIMSVVLGRSRTLRIFFPRRRRGFLRPLALPPVLFLLLPRYSFVLTARGRSLSPTSRRSFFRTNVKSRTGETTAASCEEPDPDG